jgi:hypothetical protein
MRKRDSKRIIVRLGYQIIVVLVRFDVPIFLGIELILKVPTAGPVVILG